MFDASKQVEESITIAGEDEYGSEPRREKHTKKRRRKEKNSLVINSDAEFSVVATDGESPPSTTSKETKKLKETEEKKQIAFKSFYSKFSNKFYEKKKVDPEASKKKYKWFDHLGHWVTFLCSLTDEIVFCKMKNISKIVIFDKYYFYLYLFLTRCIWVWCIQKPKQNSLLSLEQLFMLLLCCIAC